jgi:alpha-ketoglutarate-dependent taurine dioxygenase
MRALQVDPISGALGAEVSRVNLRSDLDDAMVQSIRAACLTIA